jgi:hypothetical protein
MPDIQDPKRSSEIDALEKRRFERFKAELQVRYRVLHPEERSQLLQDGQFIEPDAIAGLEGSLRDLMQVFGQDISLGGFSLATPQPLPRSIELLVQLTLPLVPIPVSALAEVRWCRPMQDGNGHQSGLKFSGISAQDLSRLDSFLRLQKRS